MPLGFLGYQSLQTGSFDVGYVVRLGVGQLLGRDLDATTSSSCARWCTPGSRPCSRCSSAIRSRTGSPSAAGAGRTFPAAIIAPFFVTYLIRTLAWQTILADEGPCVDVLRTSGSSATDGRLLATSTAVVAGITYNFLPFMALPLYVSLEQIDPRLIEAAQDLYASKGGRSCG